MDLMYIAKVMNLVDESMRKPKEAQMTETDQIINGLLAIARKYELDNEYDSNDTFQFKGVVAGMGTIVSDDVGLFLLEHHKNCGVGYSPKDQILRVSWEDDNEED